MPETIEPGKLRDVVADRLKTFILESTEWPRFARRRLVRDCQCFGLGGHLVRARHSFRRSFATTRS
jgi:hypothetical protein